MVKRLGSLKAPLPLLQELEQVAEGRHLSTEIMIPMILVEWLDAWKEAHPTPKPEKPKAAKIELPADIERSGNASGFKGVYPYNADKFRAQIGGAVVGTFDTREEAALHRYNELVAEREEQKAKDKKYFALVEATDEDRARWARERVEKEAAEAAAKAANEAQALIDPDQDAVYKPGTVMALQQARKDLTVTWAPGSKGATRQKDRERIAAMVAAMDVEEERIRNLTPDAPAAAVDPVLDPIEQARLHEVEKRLQQRRDNAQRVEEAEQRKKQKKAAFVTFATAGRTSKKPKLEEPKEPEESQTEPTPNDSTEG
jgi:hypothetical protein